MTSPRDESAPDPGAAPHSKPGPAFVFGSGLTWDAPGLTFPSTPAPVESDDADPQQGA